MVRIFKEDSRFVLLVLALLVSLFVSVYVLSGILWTFVFAATIAYTLYPFFSYLRRKGLSAFVSSIVSTFIGMFAIVALAFPFIIVVYRRRDVLFEFLRDIPESFEFEVFGFELSLDVGVIVDVSWEYLSEAAIEAAQATPTIILQFFVLVVVIYVLLYKSNVIASYILGVFDESFHSLLYGYNKKIKDTIIGLYVVQLSTAILTFFIGLPFFYLLGYEPFIFLSLIAGVLQFIPILGPSILIVGLALFEVLIGEVVSAAIVLALGLLLIAGLPDLVLRPYLADVETGLSPSQYFIGFIGGIITIGAIGIIVGPLVIAILIKTFEVISKSD
ncbi:putative PurR-regulated permease PerM [Methanonatronarchaeum thermophilum]|uniref:Putative PurR-regulated permease PerM n=1 Tax=Methanonatronarchaeum thermophilum TaxID=1927129 RepID=A0A1Y3GA69_9EURY|nr:AI-2E family transporter [Methanonatronarchaeum thermophilum]OUJ18341.1 putative PurR-regulated permease PerM [Methanonatronarchaeum thermophilum]